MYIVGLGVEQNIDKAQQWLTEAANRGYQDAMYNLALLHGTGIILKSYRMCDVPRAPEQADKYLREAVHRQQPDALRLWRQFGDGSRYGALNASDRWLLIERQELEQIRNGPFARSLRHIGKKCHSDAPLSSDPPNDRQPPEGFPADDGPPLEGDEDAR
jgi:Sel1 repeat-containing protein